MRIISIGLALIASASILFGANTPYTAFRGVGGVTVSSNVTAGTVTIDGSGISAGALPTFALTNNQTTAVTLSNSLRVVGIFTNSGGIKPQNATASRAAIIGPDGILTNAPAGSVGEYLKQDLTWGTPAGGAGGNFNVSQFSASTGFTNIKSGALLTNLSSWGTATNEGSVLNNGTTTTWTNGSSQSVSISAAAGIYSTHDIFSIGIVNDQALTFDTGNDDINFANSPYWSLGKITPFDQIRGSNIYPVRATATRVAFINPDGILTNVAAGSAGEFLKSDGTSATPAGGSATPGGSTGAIQFNEGGAFAGTNRLTYDRTNELMQMKTASKGIQVVSDSGITNLIGSTGSALSTSGNDLYFGVGGNTSTARKWQMTIDGKLIPNSALNPNGFIEALYSSFTTLTNSILYGSNVYAGYARIRRMDIDSVSNSSMTLGDNLHINGTNGVWDYSASTNASLVLTNLQLNTPVQVRILPASLTGAGWALTFNVPAAAWVNAAAPAISTNAGPTIYEFTKVSSTQTNAVIISEPVMNVATENGVETTTNYLTRTVTIRSNQRTTNYPSGALTINCATDVSAAVTNAVGGDFAITLATPVIGTSGSLSLTSDGSARTLAILCTAATITWMSTNDTVTSTNILTTASKDSLFAWKVRQKHLAGSAPITNLQVWVKNQTP